MHLCYPNPLFLVLLKWCPTFWHIEDCWPHQCPIKFALQFDGILFIAKDPPLTCLYVAESALILWVTSTLMYPLHWTTGPQIYELVKLFRWLGAKENLPRLSGSSTGVSYTQFSPCWSSVGFSRGPVGDDPVEPSSLHGTPSSFLRAKTKKPCNGQNYFLSVGWMIGAIRIQGGFMVFVYPSKSRERTVQGARRHPFCWRRAIVISDTRTCNNPSVAVLWGSRQGSQPTLTYLSNSIDTVPYSCLWVCECGFDSDRGW